MRFPVSPNSSACAAFHHSRPLSPPFPAAVLAPSCPWDGFPEASPSLVGAPVISLASPPPYRPAALRCLPPATSEDRRPPVIRPSAEEPRFPPAIGALPGCLPCRSVQPSCSRVGGSSPAIQPQSAKNRPRTKGGTGENAETERMKPFDIHLSTCPDEECPAGSSALPEGRRVVTRACRGGHLGRISPQDQSPFFALAGARALTQWPPFVWAERGDLRIAVESITLFLAIESGLRNAKKIKIRLTLNCHLPPTEGSARNGNPCLRR